MFVLTFIIDVQIWFTNVLTLMKNWNNINNAYDMQKY